MNTDQYAKYKDEPESDTIFAELHALISELDTAEETVEFHEQELKRAKAARDNLTGAQIPEVLDRMGVSEFTTTDGKKIKIVEKVFASTGGKRNPMRHMQAMQWLDDHGHGGLVKRLLAVAFDKGREEDAQQLQELLSEKNYNVKTDLTVHSSTLSAWATDMLQQGIDIPQDLFGIEVKRTVKLTGKK